MKSPLRVGAANAPKTRLRIADARPDAGRARRIATLSAAASMMLGIGAASAIFVDYLADRALARNAHAPATRPVVAQAVEPAGTRVASLGPELAPEMGQDPAAQPQPDVADPSSPEPAAEPAADAAPQLPAPIEARLPDAAAVAEVAAVGHEHAIEEPTDDPTASPIIHVEELGGGEEASLDEAAPEPDGAPDSAIDEGADDTETAAIAPDEIEPAPVAKPRKAKAKADAQPAQRDTEVASLPGVDIGGLAGHSSDTPPDGVVRTVSRSAKPAAKGSVTAGAARVTQAVNMRSSPKKGASVIGVVPASSTVSVLSCDGWCQISYNGRRGWVYKSFLATAKGQKPDQDAEAAHKVQSSRL